MNHFLFFSVAAVILSSCGSPVDTATPPPSDSVIFKDANGNVITVADVKQYDGTVSYEILDDVTVKPEAQRLHEESQQLIQQGKFPDAAEKLKQAMQVQPEWAYPPYDLAYTHSLMGDDVNALKYYALTDSLRPHGFFTCKTALWSLRAERDGLFPGGTYMAFMTIEWATNDAEKLNIAQAIVDSLPDYAPAWMELSHLLTDTSARMLAIETGLSKNPDAETKGMLLLNKAVMLNLQGKRAEATAVLGNMIFDPETTGSNKKLAEAALQNLFGTMQ